jgi:uncharacterized NAD(P)/FAD-binding protein YdhS
MPSVASDIAIVGAGFSGTLVAVHLMRQARPPLSIHLIERHPQQWARGVAYSTPAPAHLLNVRAANMGAFADDPGHFLRWVQDGDARAPESSEITAQSFAPRALYGAYLDAVLQETAAAASSNLRLNRLIDEVVSLRPDGEYAEIRCGSGRRLRARQVVLALGNFPPGDPLLQDTTFYASPRYVANPWSIDALTDVSPDSPVAFIGSGLTMVDLAIALGERGHRGPMHVISRRGLYPRIHQATIPYPAFLEPESCPKTLLGVVRRVRQEIRAAAGKGYDWRAVIDALRPDTQALWRALPLAEQRRFLRHVRGYWDVHRHRIAGEIGEKLDRLFASGQLVPHTGSVHAYREDSDGVEVVIRKRGGEGFGTIRAERVVNCSGPQCNYRKLRHPLVTNLLEQGLARPDPLALGLEVAANGALVNAAGQLSSHLYTLGPVQKGMLWETIAVPELRVQAAALAGVLLASRSAPRHALDAQTAALSDGKTKAGA